MSVLNPRLYKRAYETITKTYGTQTSAYRSMAIVKEYKRLGGKYKKASKKPSADEGLQRWLKERWIVVTPYLLEGKVIPCGAPVGQRRKHACRPLVRVDAKKTPPTIQELLKKHGKDKMLQLARTKKQYGSEKVRLNWNRINYKLLKAKKTLKKN